jgi:hypothetical protein
MSQKTAKVEAQALNRVQAETILRDKLAGDEEGQACLDVFTRINAGKGSKSYGLKDDMVLSRGPRSPRMDYILNRVDMADGMTVAEAMKKVPNGHHPSYRYSDINYDIKNGSLLDPRS